MKNPKLIVFEGKEKSEDQKYREERFSEFMYYVEEINRLGKQIGRTALAHDFMMSLMCITGFAGNSEFQDEINIHPKGKKITPSVGKR